MKRNFGIIILAAMSVWVWPLDGHASKKMKEYRHQEVEENKAFHQSLKDMTPEQKAGAVKEHMQEERQERLEFLKKMHEEKMEHLKKKLNHSDKLSDQQRQDMLAKEENQYQEELKNLERRHEEKIAEVQKITHDSSLTPEQKKQALNDLHDQYKEANQEHREEHREKVKERRQEFKETHKVETH